MARSKTFKLILPIVWESIVERCARMDVRPSFSVESGIVFRVGDHVFAGLTVLQAANMLLVLEAAYAALSYECYACMKITLNGRNSGGFLLCSACIAAYP
jgi:hypothetical protein